MSGNWESARGSVIWENGIMIAISSYDGEEEDTVLSFDLDQSRKIYEFIGERLGLETSSGGETG